MKFDVSADWKVKFSHHTRLTLYEIALYAYSDYLTFFVRKLHEFASFLKFFPKIIGCQKCARLWIMRINKFYLLILIKKKFFCEIIICVTIKGSPISSFRTLTCFCVKKNQFNLNIPLNLHINAPVFGVSRISFSKFSFRCVQFLYLFAAWRNL